MPYCSNCGTEVEPGIKFCPNCGAPQSGGSFAPRSTSPRSSRPSRPTPVVVFSILYLILGVVLISLWLLTLGSSSAAVIALSSLVFLGNGALSLVTFYGFFRGSRWAFRVNAVTGLCCIIGGGILALSLSILLVVGSFAIILGASTLAYLRSVSGRAYLSR